MPIVIQQGQGGLNGNGSHRPFAVALLLVLLFLSTRSDWNTAARRQRMEVRTGMGRNSPQTQSAMRDKLLLDLLKSNEKLERENKALRYRMMLLNRTMRSCGCNHTDLPFDAFIEEEAAPFPCDKERSTAEIRASVDEMLDRGVVDTDTTQQDHEDHGDHESLRGRGRPGERAFRSRSSIPQMRDRAIPA
mmetsp:Transcript_42876/g.107390  ORF Transcript_42876/g.107390 Transcript_42876/m.107390 type:complete len:190 (+) Transcript_42876:418-987(+)|eukprot:jgi/Tetstr1/449258/TSEL_036463.t1